MKVLLETEGDDLGDVFGVAGGNGVVLALDDLEDEGGLGTRLEGMQAGTHFVENAPEGPDVAAVVVGFFLTELRREIIRGAHDGVCEVAVLF